MLRCDRIPVMLTC